jgi:hypothetical protein
MMSTKTAFSAYPITDEVVGSRIHFWLTDDYEGRSAVGYFYYEPGLEAAHP